MYVVKQPLVETKSSPAIQCRSWPQLSGSHQLPAESDTCSLVFIVPSLWFRRLIRAYMMVTEQRVLPESSPW
jgi:hypothetical protein